MIRSLLLCSALAGASPAAPLTVGEPFPILKLPRCGNETESTSIEAFRDRKLMLHLFASW